MRGDCSTDSCKEEGVQANRKDGGARAAMFAVEQSLPWPTQHTRLEACSDSPFIVSSATHRISKIIHRDMASPIFCCAGTKPYRPRSTDHESKFTAFMSAATANPSIISAIRSTPVTQEPPSSATPPDEVIATEAQPTTAQPPHPYAIQFIKQINFGPVEEKRYFAPTTNDTAQFIELTERDLIDANYSKVNSYKNFKCATHNRFYELNLYQKDPVQKHHWRADIARPGAEIDL